MTDDEKEAFEKIKDAAAVGTIGFAADDLTGQLDEEIQDIYRAFRLAQTGAEPRRPIWVADVQPLSLVLGRGGDGNIVGSDLQALVAAGKALGIDLDPNEFWEVAALRLRSHRSLQ